MTVITHTLLPRTNEAPTSKCLRKGYFYVWRPPSDQGAGPFGTMREVFDEPTVEKMVQDKEAIVWPTLPRAAWTKIRKTLHL